MEALLKAGHNQTMIATILSIDKSTVSCELRRNQGLRGYRIERKTKYTVLTKSSTKHAKPVRKSIVQGLDRSVYQNKCVNGIFKKLKNNLVAEPVGPVKNGFLFFTSP